MPKGFRGCSQPKPHAASITRNNLCDDCELAVTATPLFSSSALTLRVHPHSAAPFVHGVFNRHIFMPASCVWCDVLEYSFNILPSFCVRQLCTIVHRMQRMCVSGAPVRQSRTFVALADSHIVARLNSSQLRAVIICAAVPVAG